MTREQENTTMGAHAARTGVTRPTTVARLATTTLAVAVTGVLGAGTALAHDGSGHDGHGGHGGHHEQDEHAGRSIEAAHAEAARAHAEAEQDVQDALAELGMDDGGDADTDSGSDAGEHPASSPAPAAPAPGHPSSGTRTTTQPIAAPPDNAPTSDVPPVGETRTIPIR